MVVRTQFQAQHFIDLFALGRQHNNSTDDLSLIRLQTSNRPGAAAYNPAKSGPDLRPVPVAAPQLHHRP